MKGTSTALLGTEEPPPFEIVNTGGKCNLVLACDHASNRVPARLDNLGLTAQQLDSHIGWDPGAAEVSRRLAARLDAPLLLSNYSRLVIDCNRWPSDPEFIPESSDGIIVPGNVGLPSAEAALRRRTLFDPYHAALAALLRAPGNKQPVLLSIHSFTPSLSGTERPWPIGVCYRQNVALAARWLDALQQRLSEPVGNNQPYEVELDIDYTIPQQAENIGIDGIMLELRQDSIADEAGVRRWSDIIAECWLAIASN